MFRIKTDIRHYKCEDRDKVDRLIRNWVIRPTDLIFDGDTEQWQPIGNHSSFVELFASLDKAHENQPDTVITDRAANTAASDRGQPDPTPRAAVFRSAGRSRSRVQVQPPTPSDEVEGVIRDPKEITIMTDKTLDLLTDNGDGDGESEVHDVAEDATEDIVVASTEIPAGPTEDTSQVELPDFGDEADENLDDDSSVDDEITEDSTVKTSSAEANDEPSAVRLGRHDLPEDVFATAELPHGVDREKLEQERLDELGEFDDHALSEESSGVQQRRENSPSRWNIVLDDIKPPDDDDNADNTDDDARSDAAEEAADDQTINALRDTADLHEDELPGNEIQNTDSPASSDSTEDLVIPDDSDEVSEDIIEDSEQDDDSDAVLEDSAQDGDPDEVLEESEEDGDSDEDLRETADLTPAAVAVAAGIDITDETQEPDEEQFEIDDDALDDAIVDLEASAIAARESQENEEDLEELPILEVTPLQNLDQVSGGYDMEFLSPILPSEEALKLGIRRSKISEQRRERLFSLPVPKKPGQVHNAEFQLPPHSSIPASLIALIVLSAVVLILLALILMN